MQKIISLFQRNYETDHLVRNEIVPGAEWVIAGEGVATRKLDGMCAMVRDGKLYKRHDVKKGRTPPVDFEPAQDPDPKTGHWPGWVPIGDSPADKYFREAFAPEYHHFEDGTYELLGPKIQGNPEGFFIRHVLFPHGTIELPDAPRDYDGLKEYFRSHDIEGIVWHHPDGRMVKIKGKDFGIKRGKK